MLATFCEVFHPRNYLSNSLRANYENFDQITDRNSIYPRIEGTTIFFDTIFGILGVELGE